MFINIPNNFSSMWGELTYESSCTDTTDILIEILDSSSDESLGVKKFYSSTSAKINPAPMLFDLMLPDVEKLDFTSSVTAATGFPLLALSDGEEQSEERIFTYSKSDLSAPAVLYTMPTSRLLHEDECDVVTFVAEEGSQIEYELWGVAIDDSSEQLILCEEITVSNCAMQFGIAAADYTSLYSALYLTLSCDGQQLALLSYSLVQSNPSGYRVAWISSAGGIEHYTFPTIISQTYNSSGETIKSLRSAYGRAAEVEALSEILTSPKVWRVQGGDYSLIEVETTEQQIRSEGALMVTTLTVKENG